MSDEAIWTIYFSQLASWRHHPGYGKYNNPESRPTLEQCAEEADEMLLLTLKRRKLWQQ